MVWARFEIEQDDYVSLIVMINDVSLFSTSNNTLLTNERDVDLLFM